VFFKAKGARGLFGVYVTCWRVGRFVLMLLVEGCETKLLISWCYCSSDEFFKLELCCISQNKRRVDDWLVLRGTWLMFVD
jgi:hypothetical protein